MSIETIDSVVEEGLADWDRRINDNPYGDMHSQTDDGTASLAWSWNDGWQKGKANFVSTVKSEGIKACTNGASFNNNPYSEDDKLKSRYSNLEVDPRRYWVEGWLEIKDAIVCGFREDNRSDIEQAIEYLNSFSSEWEKYSAAYSGNLFTHGLFHFRAKKEIDSLRAKIFDSPQAQLIKKAGYCLIGQSAPWSCFDQYEKDKEWILMGLTANVSEQFSKLV